jgi:predicted dehydrogenase
MKIAFLGIDNPHGSAWRELLRNLEDELEIVAVLPGFGGATTSLEERYSVLPRFETVEQLLQGASFDGAVVCLPNDAGPPAIERLAEAGKHVLAEKPVAGCAADVQPLLERFRSTGVAFQNGYMWRYDEGANRLREMVRDGRFGRLISVEMLYATSDVRRRGADHYLFDRKVSQGGFFNWLACHYLDLLLYVIGQPVVGVTARVGVFGATPVDVEDGGTAILELAGGTLVTFVGGYWLPRWAGENGWTIRGSERWVRWDPTRAGTSGVLEIHGPQPQWFPMDETVTLPADNTPGYGGARGLALLRDWLASASEGGRDCRNTVASTHATLQVIDAIYQSSREGRRIECDIEAR